MTINQKGGLTLSATIASEINEEQIFSKIVKFHRVFVDCLFSLKNFIYMRDYDQCKRKLSTVYQIS